MSLLIGENMVVSMHYTLTNDQGAVIDKSEEAEPLTYLHGAGNIIPGMENALTGKVTEDELQVTVVPKVKSFRDSSKWSIEPRLEVWNR